MINEFIGKTLADKYEVEELLREGDFGNVYSARHLLMEKPVAIKILAPALAVDESIVESFSIEARTISRLSHPNILNVTDFGRDVDGTVFIVMESAEGKTLKDAIRDEGAFSVDRAVRIARQIAAGLSVAHANLLIHGHLTSENILLTKMANDSEIVKVFNLGSFDSVRREDYDNEESLKDLAYLSPEQCSGESEADERADIYALGIIFYEMLVGEVPFDADNPTDLMLKHAEVPPPPFAAFRDDIPDEIEPLAIRALAKNPDMRYQTASAFAEDLNEAMSVDGKESPMIVPAAVAQVSPNNNVWKTAFIVLAGISLLAFGMIYWTNIKQLDPTTVQQVDENGQPVQPLNPATGLNENVPNMTDYQTGSLDPNDPLINSDVGGGGDGYDPWSRPGTPPGGSPSYVPVGPAGNTVTIPGNSGSIFNQEEPVGYDERGNPIYLVRQPVKKPSTSPETDVTKKPNEGKKDPSDKVGEKLVDPKMPVKKPTTKPSPKADSSPTKKPATKKPADKPKAKTPPATKSQKTKSGVEQDT